MRLILPPSSLPLVLCSVLASACGDEALGRGEGSAGTAVTKGDDLDENTSTTSGDDVPFTAHHDAVVECEAIAAHARDHLNAARADELVAVERERTDCLVAANDAARETVAAVLAASGDSWADQTVGVWDAQRSTAVNACNGLVEAHGEAVGDRRPVVAATCIALGELQFAEVLDAYVDFGEVPFSIPGARDRYPSCYTAYDDAVNNPAGVDPLAESVAAEEQLAECIHAEHDALVPELAARVAELFPGRDAVQVEGELLAAMTAQIEARTTVCIVAAHAGVDRDAPELDLERAECLVDAAVQAGDVIALVAPDLIGDGSANDDAADGGTDGGESGSTSL